MKNTSKEASGGIPTKIPKRIAAAEKADLNKGVDLLPSDEDKLNDLDLDLLRIKVGNCMRQSAITKEEDATPTAEENFKH